MSTKSRTAILFVCLGNICRSPLAEGVFRAIVAERGLEHAFEIDSAALGDWHVGGPPDARSVAVAHRVGIDISLQRARQIALPDFSRFDLIFGMDRSNISRLRELAPKEARQRIHLFLDYALGKEEDVPDPYYGTEENFSEVYEKIREASGALISRLAPESPPRSGQASSIT